jgi:Icc protein
VIPLGQYPLPTHTIAHVSDPHLLAERLLYGAIDTHQTLRNAMLRLARLELPPRAIVFTGDLADRAEPKAYVKLREIVEPAAAEIGADVIWVMGNHDEREHYARELFGEEVTEEVTQDRVHDVDGLRVISLDTSVPGYHHGEVTPDQLAWLRDQLSSPAPHGTVLAMHHPPIPVPMVRAAEVIELHDQHLLAEVIEGTDVRGVIGGHFHFSSYSTFAGVPVSVASSTCYLADPAPDGRLLSAVDGHQSVTMMHFYGDRIVHSVVPVPEAEEKAGYPLELVDQIEALPPAERHELLSAKDSPVWVHESPPE